MARLSTKQRRARKRHGVGRRPWRWPSGMPSAFIGPASVTFNGKACGTARVMVNYDAIRKALGL